MGLTIVMQAKCFGGMQRVYSHDAKTTNCLMRFGVYLPPQANDMVVPAVYWLSGLTCTEENFITKAGAQRMAAKLGIAIIVPDTSPRGVSLPGDHDNYDFGVGAGFYIDATCSPWSSHYQMYSYITTELYQLVATQFPIDASRIGILGHSMGGHGAITIAVKNPQLYRSVSAFAPIASPMRSPWGVKALSGYLGDDQTPWLSYDATALIISRGWAHSPILVDQGTKDTFLETQLKPNLLYDACLQAKVPLTLRMQDGYDHSYYFIASFINDHLAFHAKHLNNIAC